MAIYFRDDCRMLRDSLQLELVVAQYCMRIRELRSTAGVPAGEVVGADVSAELEREGDPLSHAILRAVAHLAAGEMATRSSQAATRLTERGTRLPQRFADVGEASAVAAWRIGGDLDGEQAVFAEFEHPRVNYAREERGEKFLLCLSRLTDRLVCQWRTLAERDDFPAEIRFPDREDIDELTPDTFGTDAALTRFLAVAERFRPPGEAHGLRARAHTRRMRRERPAGSRRRGHLLPRH